MARFDRTIPPGGEGIITLEVDTKDEQGAIHKTARVFSNDPNISGLTIGIKGNVWAPIHVMPKHLRLTGFLNEKIATIVGIKSQMQAPLELKLISVSIPDKVDVSLKETEKEDPFDWQLLVENKVNQETTYRGEIKLSTNYPEAPELVIQIAGNLRLSVETRPRVLHFGRLMDEHFQQLKTSRASVGRPVDVISNKAVDLKIEDVDFKNGLFKVINVSEKQSGQIYRVQIEPFWEKIKKGVNTDTLEITTNQNDSRSLEVPVILEIL